MIYPEDAVFDMTVKEESVGVEYGYTERHCKKSGGIDLDSIPVRFRKTQAFHSRCATGCIKRQRN